MWLLIFTLVMVGSWCIFLSVHLPQGLQMWISPVSRAYRPGVPNSICTTWTWQSPVPWKAAAWSCSSSTRSKLTPSPYGSPTSPWTLPRHSLTLRSCWNTRSLCTWAPCTLSVTLRSLSNFTWTGRSWGWKSTPWMSGWRLMRLSWRLSPTALCAPAADLCGTRCSGSPHLPVACPWWWHILTGSSLTCELGSRAFYTMGLSGALGVGFVSFLPRFIFIFWHDLSWRDIQNLRGDFIWTWHI